MTQMLSQSPLSLPHLYYQDFSRLGEEIRGYGWCTGFTLMSWTVGLSPYYDWSSDR